MKQKILVWDRATRIFHWSLVSSFFGAYLTADSDYRVFHVMFGYTLMGLILFRLLWGFVGPRYARFKDFVRGPGTVFAYVKSLLTAEPKHYVGHNPAGALAVVLLLSLGLLLTITGLLSYDEQWGERIGRVHDWISTIMLGVVGIHVGGTLVSSVLHRENLILAMLTGHKEGEAHHSIAGKCSITALLLAGLIAAFWLLAIPGGFP
jgi:cytochrome b